MLGGSAVLSLVRATLRDVVETSGSMMCASMFGFLSSTATFASLLHLPPHQAPFNGFR